MIRPKISHGKVVNAKCVSTMECIIDKDNVLSLERELIEEMNATLKDPSCRVGICLNEINNCRTVSFTELKQCNICCDADTITFKYDNEDEHYSKFFSEFMMFVFKSKEASTYSFDISFECENIPRAYQMKFTMMDIVYGDKSVTFKTNNMYLCSTIPLE